MSDQQLYRMDVAATGEVRDADGHLVSTQPVEASIILTQAQYDQLAKEKDS